MLLVMLLVMLLMWLMLFFVDVAVPIADQRNVDGTRGTDVDS